MAQETRPSTSIGRPAILPAGLLHAAFEEHAVERPHAIALRAGDVALTYGELAARTASVRFTLLRAGVARGDRVAVVMHRGWEAVVALLATVGAGAAYVPIEAELPAERVRRLVEEARPVCVLTQTSLVATQFGAPAVVIGDELSAACAAPVQPVAPDDLAYVIFTSGSTGQPKGVMIEHGAAHNTIAEINRRFAVGPNDAVLAVSPFSFDLSVYDVFGLLAAGGRVVIPDPVLRRSPRYVAEVLASEHVTVWNSAPPVMELLVRDLEARGARLPESLRLVMLSGDWIDVALPDRIRALGSGVEVVSLGGATEASIWSIAYPIGRVDPAWRSIPYGHPLANQSWCVLDESLQPCERGERGMLYIGGAGLARGYWNDPVKTANAFVTHPGTGERIYRTGDFGRVMDDAGTLEILGREDTQVKIRGYRVELGEIEAALRACDGVRSARVVLAAASGPGAGSHSPRDLVATVVVPGAQPGVEGVLRAQLRSTLPEHAIPGTINVVHELPLTENGKVDVRALAGSAPRRS